MGKSFLPEKEGDLLAWSANFQAHIQSAYATYGFTSAQASAYSALHDAYASAMALCDAPVRNKVSTAAKNAAREALKEDARVLAQLIGATITVTDAQKLSLGLTVRKARSPIPPPASAPSIDIVQVVGWTVKVKLHDSMTIGRRGKPHGVMGASIFTFVGEEPPADRSNWTFQESTGRTTLDITFGGGTSAGADAIMPGTKVWFTANWFNPRQQPGPICPPVSTHLQGGTLRMAA